MGSQGLSGDIPGALEQRQSRFPPGQGLEGLQEGQGSRDSAAQQSFSVLWPRVGKTVGLSSSCRRRRALLTTAAPTPTPCIGRKPGPSCPHRKEEREGCDTQHTALAPQCLRCSSPAIATASTAEGSSRATKFPVDLHTPLQVVVLGFDPLQANPPACLKQESNPQLGYSSWCPGKHPGSSCPQSRCHKPSLSQFIQPPLCATEQLLKWCLGAEKGSLHLPPVRATA